ncbi:hypothetical protein L7F22_061801 [Adiantum nelumboides]|nr:hypothetical protein [Adiantum nelumboides]
MLLYMRRSKIMDSFVSCSKASCRLCSISCKAGSMYVFGVHQKGVPCLAQCCYSLITEPQEIGCRATLRCLLLNGKDDLKLVSCVPTNANTQGERLRATQNRKFLLSSGSPRAEKHSRFCNISRRGPENLPRVFLLFAFMFAVCAIHEFTILNLML